MTDVYHHVLGWKACYTCFSAVLFKPTSRTERKVSISSPSGEGGGHGCASNTKENTWFPLVLLQVKAVGSIREYI